MDGLYSTVRAQSLVDLLEQIFLEFFEIIFIQAIVGNLIKPKQRRLGKDILKVCKLLLQNGILSGQSSIFLVAGFLNPFKFLNLNLEFILVVSFPHATSDSTFSVLHPPLITVKLKKLTFEPSYILQGPQRNRKRHFCPQSPRQDIHVSCS